MKLTQEQKEELLARVKLEHRVNYILPVHLPLTELLVLIAHLQLALRHPANVGPSARAAQQIIDQIIDRMREDGFPAHAELAEVGANPENDELSAAKGRYVLTDLRILDS